jgi:hypothetical protein
MRARLIYEKFVEKSDPIHDMGIGYINGLLKNRWFPFKNVESVIPPEWPDWFEVRGMNPENTDIIVIFSDDFKNEDKTDYKKIKRYIEKKGIKFICTWDEGGQRMSSEFIIVDKNDINIM